MRTKTTFIIGAGASKEVDLPLGDELNSNISKKLDIRYSPDGKQNGDADRRTVGIIQSSSRLVDEKIKRACTLISSNLPLSNSIDSYLSRQNHDIAIQICGKVGIALTILESESKCDLLNKKRKFSEDDSILFDSTKKTYFKYL